MTTSTEELHDRERVTWEVQRHPGSVFVFGSNRAGVHGAGAARVAQARYGAQHGRGEGRAGRSYAIPTKATWRDRGLPLAEIGAHVARFLRHARQQPDVVFVVTRIGCGYAGYRDADIAPLFADAPVNCLLPEGWREQS